MLCFWSREGKITFNLSEMRRKTEINIKITYSTMFVSHYFIIWLVCLLPHQTEIYEVRASLLSDCMPRDWHVVDILVAWAAITKNYRLGGINDRKLFLIVLAAGKSRFKVLANLVPVESFLPGLLMATVLLYLHMTETVLSVFLFL